MDSLKDENKKSNIDMFTTINIIIITLLYIKLIMKAKIKCNKIQ